VSISLPLLCARSVFTRKPSLRATLLLLILQLPSAAVFAAAPKIHTVTLGPYRRVPYTQPDATPDTKSDETSTLKIRPLFVDDRQKEWTTGEIHDVTDRTFAVRRALRINDSLPTDAVPRWVWQPGPAGDGRPRHRPYHRAPFARL
jgi:hypothetical protein